MAYDAEAVPFLLHPFGRARNKISQFQFVPRPGLQIIGQPLIEENLVVAHVRRDQRRAGRRHHGIRGGFGAVAQFIDKVGQDQFFRSGRGGASERGLRDRRIQKTRSLRSSNPPGDGRNSH